MEVGAQGRIGKKIWFNRLDCFSSLPFSTNTRRPSGWYDNITSYILTTVDSLQLPLPFKKKLLQLLSFQGDRNPVSFKRANFGYYRDEHVLLEVHKTFPLAVIQGINVILVFPYAELLR